MKARKDHNDKLVQREKEFLIMANKARINV